MSLLKLHKIIKETSKFKNSNTTPKHDFYGEFRFKSSFPRLAGPAIVR